jgi:Subtilase family
MIKRSICIASAVLAAATQADAFVAQSPGGISKNAERILSEIAKPMTAPVQRGLSPKDVARELCGRVTPTYVELLQKANPGKSVDAITGYGTYTFPACFVLQPDADVKAKSGETVRELAERTVGLSGEKTLRNIYERNSDIFRSMGIQSFDKEMVGTTTLSTVSLMVPNVTAPTVYELKADAAPGSVQKLARETGRGVREDTDLVLESDIELESDIGPRARGNVSCQGSSIPDAWPFDAARLEEALLRNDMLRAQLGLNPVEPVTLAVADNGMDGIFSTAFPRDVFAINPGEVPDDERDNDSNNFIDDLVGVNVFSGGEPRQAGGKDPWHGTHIAGLVLGGPAYRARNSSSMPRLRVRLLAISMVERTTRPGINGNVTTYAMPARGVQEAFEYAVARKASVMNLSVSTKDELQFFKTSVASSGVVLVVAAGNRAIDYTNDNRYPASYGGQVNPTLPLPVITVAAHDRQGCLTSFSGRSAERVDLAAPGVAIESNDIGGIRRTAEGTSQATALVSFTVALLSAEGLPTRSIKRRLLASTDFQPSLENYVLTGGSLNVIKAVSRYEDLVQTTAGLEHGQLDTAFDLATLCPGVPSGVILKIFRAQAGAPLRVLLERSNQTLRVTNCTPTITSFGFQTESGRRDVPLSDILDVVPRS